MVVMARVRAVALVTGQAGAVVVLQRLGAAGGLAVPADAPLAWLSAAPPEVAITAVLRLVGLALSWWLVACSAAAVTAALTGVPAAVRAVRVATVPLLRPVVDRVVALALAGATLTASAATPAWAAAPPPAATAQPAEEPAPPFGHLSFAAGTPVPPAAAPPPALPRPLPSPTGTTDPALPSPGGGAATTPPLPPSARPAPAGGSGAASPFPPGAFPAGNPAVPHTPPEGNPAMPATHVVAPGDNLWGIAAARLGGAGTTAREVHAYWVRLIAANRDHLRSGDPDLVHPGEVLLLPAVEEPVS